MAASLKTFDAVVEGPSSGSQFKKDFKRLRSSNHDINVLIATVMKLAQGEAAGEARSLPRLRDDEALKVRVDEEMGFTPQLQDLRLNGRQPPGEFCMQ